MHDGIMLSKLVIQTYLFYNLYVCIKLAGPITIIKVIFHKTWGKLKYTVSIIICQYFHLSLPLSFLLSGSVLSNVECEIDVLLCFKPLFLHGLSTKLGLHVSDYTLIGN